MAHLNASELDLVASFFSERIEEVKAEHGSTVFIQRPKAVAEGFTASASELPDDFDVYNIAANSNQTYRISIGQLGFVIDYNPADMTVALSVKAHVPIIGGVTIAKAKGNVKHGVTAKLNYKGLVTGEASIKLHDNSVALHYNFNAFGNKLKDNLPLFSI